MTCPTALDALAYLVHVRERRESMAERDEEDQ